MLGLALLIVAFGSGAALIIWFMTRFAERVTGKIVSDHFHDAEFILTHHQAPKAWARTNVKTRLLRRLDNLIGFFETCPFFEDEDSRDELLAQLRAERISWESAPLEGLISRP